MKSDVDQVMTKRGLDALWVTGSALHNPCMTYFTGLAHLTHADLIVHRQKPPELYHFSMEREEAARTGLACHDYITFNLDQILREAGGDRTRAGALRMARVFAEQGVRGRVAVIGKVESGPLVALVDAMRQTIHNVELVGEDEQPLLMEVRATKSPKELEHLRAIGKISTAVLADTAEFLTSHPIRNTMLTRKDGEPLRVGDVKERIRRTVAELGGEIPEGLIFAAGRDGGIPHSSGTDSDILRAGVPIVFDFFPQEAGGGYFYDITRTWCVGYAPEEVASIHAQVLSAYQEAVETARIGTACRSLQRRVCERFEAEGHPTVWHTPQTEAGYVHSLGHGVGLDIHERPLLSDAEGNTDTLAPGMVFTIEPGLYYPEHGLGVRLEDTCWMDSNGVTQVIAPYPLDLVLPARQRAGSLKSILKKPSAPKAGKKPRTPKTKR